jgi:Flp pilus assembly protein TadG
MRAATKVARALRSTDPGQALAEMAVIAPLLLLLLIGLVEVGRYANFSILVSNAARAGVQYGAQNLVTAADNTGMQNAATADAQNIAGLTAVATHLCKCADGSASTCLPADCTSSHRLVYVQVDTTGTLTSLLNFGGVVPSLQVRGHAVMRAAQ